MPKMTGQTTNKGDCRVFGGCRRRYVKGGTEVLTDVAEGLDEKAHFVWPLTYAFNKLNEDITNN